MEKRKSTVNRKSTARPAAKKASAKEGTAKEALRRAIEKAAEPPKAVKAAGEAARKGKRNAKAKAAPAKAAKKEAPAAKKKEALVGLTKQYFKSKDVCRITFRVPRPAAQDATPMKRLKDGSFSAIMELPKGKEYRFRYLLDGGRWENDWCADRYEPSPFGGENSVVVC
jgi:glucan-binding YG repeat protein